MDVFEFLPKFLLVERCGVWKTLILLFTLSCHRSLKRWLWRIKEYTTPVERDNAKEIYFFTKKYAQQTWTNIGDALLCKHLIVEKDPFVKDVMHKLVSTVKSVEVKGTSRNSMAPLPNQEKKIKWSRRRYQEVECLRLTLIHSFQ
jgi:hypothetical protein